MIKNIYSKIINKVASQHKAEAHKETVLATALGIAKQLNYKRHSFDMTIERSEYFIDIHITDSKELFVSFEFGGFDKKGAINREAWGGGYFRYRDVSYIGVKPKWNNWYLSPPLDVIIEELRPILVGFESIVTYGSSMGGFAALTYADLLGASKVVSFCPQSSRIPRICSWESPSKVDLKRMHSDSIYADAVGKYRNAEDVFIFADLHEERDRRHAERLKAGNVRVINTPYIGHSVPTYLGAMGILKDIPIDVARNRFDEIDFIRRMRSRRNLQRYFDIMKEKTKNSPRRRAIVEAHRGRSKLLGPP